MKEQVKRWKLEKRYINSKFFYLSVLAGIGLGILNAYLDTFVFFVGPGTFLDFLILSVPTTEAFARTVVLMLFVVFGYLFSKKYAQLEDSKMLLEYSLDKSSEAIYWLSGSGNIYYVNQSAAKSLGYTVKELERLSTYDLHKSDKNFTQERWQEKWKLLQEKNILQFETQHSKKNGDIINVEIVANHVVHNDIQYLVAFVRDITKRKEKEREILSLNKKLEKFANNDILTGIFNRSKFDDFLKQFLSEHKRYKKAFSFIMYDIDFFKKVNDVYGHKAGDNVLKEFVSITKKLTRESDIFARWGGEEFVILLPHTNLETAISVANKIRKAVEKHHFENIGNLTVSIGVVTVAENDTCESIFIRADKALYEAKNSGRNKVIVER